MMLLGFAGADRRIGWFSSKDHEGRRGAGPSCSPSLFSGKSSRMCEVALAAPASLLPDAHHQILCALDHGEEQVFAQSPKIGRGDHPSNASRRLI
jgi:hypothetical protein